MTDPFSISVGVTGLLSVATTSVKGLHNYYRSYQNHNDTVNRLYSSLESLSASLQRLHDVLQSRDFIQEEQHLIKQINDSILACKETIADLEDELARFSTSKVAHTLKDRARGVARRFEYPLKAGTIRNVQDSVNDLVRGLAFALQILNIVDAQSASQDLNGVKLVLAKIRSTYLSVEIRTWLSAPDPSTNHEEAAKSRHPRTGLWFLQSSEFKQWLRSPSWLWLTGFAGCGKSVLCSTAIEHVLKHQQSRSQRIGVGFFYFAFTDPQKQDLSGMLKSIVIQLSHQAENQQYSIEKWYDSIKPAAPSVTALMRVFLPLLAQFDDVYLFLDAVDEVPVGQSRKALLQQLTTIHAMSLSNLHVLTTSRDHRSIREAMQPLATQVSLSGQHVDEGIALFVREHLEQNLTLTAKWQPHRAIIETALTQGARGMFRWVQCQFRELEQCPVRMRDLHTLLHKLPHDLDETYQRMLEQIHPDRRVEAKRLLSLLCFATRPLFTREIIDYLAVVASSDAGRIDPDLIYQDENDLIEICPGFVEITTEYHEFVPARRLRIPHFSLQEYLTSERLSNTSSVSFFLLEKDVAHAEIAQTCLAYLLSGTLSLYQKDAEVKVRHPFLSYASLEWDHHHRLCQTAMQKPTSLAYTFCVELSEDSFRNWWRLRQLWHGYSGSMVHRPRRSPLSFAARLRLRDVVDHIVTQARANPARALRLMNREEASAFNFRQKKATLKWHRLRDVIIDVYYLIWSYMIVLFRLNHQSQNVASVTEIADEGRSQADTAPVVDYDGRFFESSTGLHEAIQAGRLDMVQTFVDAGMKVDFKTWVMQGNTGSEGTLLVLALYHKQEDIAKLLISCGADTQAAMKSLKMKWGTDKHDVRNMIKFLDKVGLKPWEAAAPFQNDFLIAAIKSAELDVVRQLLDNGVDITDHSTNFPINVPIHFHCPLSCALVGRKVFCAQETAGLFHIMGGRLLTAQEKTTLDDLVDLFMQILATNKEKTICCEFTIEKAVVSGRLDVLEELLKRANNEYSPEKRKQVFKTSVYSACKEGHVDFLEILLRYGASPSDAVEDLIWGHDPTIDPFDRFPNIGHTMRLLLRQDGLTASQTFAAAAFLGDTHLVRQFIEMGDVPYDIGMVWAIRRGHTEIVGLLRSLIKHRAWTLGEVCRSKDYSIWQQYVAGDYTSLPVEDGLPLYLAAKHGFVEAVKVLLQLGADPNKPFGKITVDVPRLLKWKHDDSISTPTKPGLNTHNTFNSTPLSIASENGHASTVEALIAHGADVNPRDETGHHRPLRLACARGHSQVIKLLVHAGADVNAADRIGQTPLISLTRSAMGHPVDLDIVKTLYEAGADINASTGANPAFRRTTALTMAVQYAQKDVAEYLIDQGAIIDQEILEATQGHREMLAMLHLRRTTQARPVVAELA